MLFQDIEKALEFIDKKIEYPDLQTIVGSPTNPEIVISGKKVLIFCSNNYLGVAADPRIKTAVKNAVDIYGMGSGGSRLVSGNTAIQEQLEKKIAEFKGAEDAITFATGYMTNTGVIPALLNPPITSVTEYIKEKILPVQSIVFSDELNHASIIDGIRLSKTEKAIYKHRDINDLESRLRHKRSYRRKLIVTDGIFSMDGDIAPLDQIMELALRYGATVMVDDAHATGILGIGGKGTVEYFKIKQHPELIVMGTFTKVFGGIGGFIVGPRKLIRYLRVTTRPYIFSAPIPPAIAAGIIEAIDIISTEPDRRLKLWDNINYTRNLLDTVGFNTLRSETQIIPIFIGDDKKAIRASRRLLEIGIFIPCIRWPAVPHSKSRLRLTLMSLHTKGQIRILVDALLKIKGEFNF